jgi:hypothetical protein
LALAAFAFARLSGPQIKAECIVRLDCRMPAWQGISISRFFLGVSGSLGSASDAVISSKL